MLTFMILSALGSQKICHICYNLPIKQTKKNRIMKLNIGIFTKGGFKSEDTGKFLLLQKDITSFHYLL